MKFMLMMWSTAGASGGTVDDLRAWQEYEAHLVEADVLVTGGALHDAKDGKLVGTALGGHPLGSFVTEGSYSQGPLQFNGFYLVDCPDEEHALVWANRMPTYGSVEVRELYDFSSWG